MGTNKQGPTVTSATPQASPADAQPAMDMDAFEQIMTALQAEDPDPATVWPLYARLGAAGQKLVLEDGTLGPKLRALMSRPAEQPTTLDTLRQGLSYVDEADRAIDPGRWAVDALGAEADSLYAWWSGGAAAEEQGHDASAGDAVGEEPPEVAPPPESVAQQAIDAAVAEHEVDAPKADDDRSWEAGIRKRAPKGHEDEYIGYVDAAVQRLRDKGFTNVTGHFVAAMLDCEAGRDAGGRWDEQSLNTDTNAGGLTQFLPGTWRHVAETPGTYLHDEVGRKEAELGRPLTDDEILQLRFDPEVSINAGVDYAILNLEDEGYSNRIEEAEGVGDIRDLGSDQLFHYAYIAHHEGVAKKDRGQGDAFLDVREGNESGESYRLTSGQWAANVLAKDRWAALEAAGLQDSDLPDSVQQQLANTTSEAEKAAIRSKYASSVDEANRDVFVKAYVSYIDAYTSKRESQWFA